MNTLYIKIPTIITSVIIVLLPIHASAHGTAITEQKAVGEYVAVFEHDGEGNVVAGEATNYSFELLKKESSEEAAFERAAVKITEQGTEHAVFAANLSPVKIIGRTTTTATVVLPKVGSYAAHVIFYAGENKLAESSFPFSVQENITHTLEENKGTHNWFEYIFFALLAIVVVESAWLIKNRTPHKNLHS